MTETNTKHIRLTVYPLALSGSVGLFGTPRLLQIDGPNSLGELERMNDLVKQMHKGIMIETAPNRAELNMEVEPSCWTHGGKDPWHDKSISIKFSYPYPTTMPFQIHMTKAVALEMVKKLIDILSKYDLWQKDTPEIGPKQDD